MATQRRFIPRIFRKRYAFPSEHGAWIWWIGPFVLGIAAGGGLNSALGILLLAALAAFLSRQPTTLVVKVLSGRRPSSDMAPALIWASFYLAIALGSAAFLINRGYSSILLLAVPGLPVFAWQFWLISRKEERGQQGIELVGSGVLALSAPAAYWVSGGENALEAWIIWWLSWLHSAASIVYVYLRLHQRKLTTPLSKGEKWRMGARTLVYHLFNFSLASVLAIKNLIPFGVPIAFALVLLEALAGVANPPLGAKPTAIGFRQLASSSFFFLVASISFVI